MKYIILWAFMNIHTGAIDGPFVESNKEYTADQCTKALVDKGAQRPSKDGKVKIYECVHLGRRSTVQFTEM